MTKEKLTAILQKSGIKKGDIKTVSEMSAYRELATQWMDDEKCLLIKNASINRIDNEKHSFTKSMFSSTIIALTNKRVILSVKTPSGMFLGGKIYSIGYSKIDSVSVTGRVNLIIQSVSKKFSVYMGYNVVDEAAKIINSKIC